MAFDFWVGRSTEIAIPSEDRAIMARGLYAARGKRVLDVCLTLLAMPVVAPLIGLLWLAVRADGGAGFYRQKRVTLGGREFTCLKLRSMVPDAESRLARHLEENPEAQAEYARMAKLSNDPRITPLGRVLRKSSLDELPQFWNVLRGEMSLVGPRPALVEEWRRFGADQAGQSKLRAGLTGLWQVSGRNTVGLAERFALDREYQAKMSLWLDFRILLRTPLVVLRMTGQ